MHIITWNVNGLRAWLKKGAMDWVHRQDADVICFQEVKSRPDQLSKGQKGQFGIYYVYWNPAERAGYSGVLPLARNDANIHVYGMGYERFDVEGRVIATQHESIWLINAYFPNGRRDLSRLEYKKDFYLRMLEYCDDLLTKGNQIVIAGDLNTAHRSIDLKNPKENAANTGFLPEERALIDTYLEWGFVDAYRRLYPSREQYTWWTYRFGARQRNIGWRLDYFLVSQNLVEHVQDVIIHDEIMGSDHCPVSLFLRFE